MIEKLLKLNKQLKLKISIKIIILLIIFSIVPVLILSTIQFFNTKEYLMSSTSSTSLEDVKLINFSLNEFFNNLSNQVNDISNYIKIIGINNTKAQTEYFTKTIDSNNTINQIYFIKNNNIINSKNLSNENINYIKNESWYKALKFNDSKINISNATKAYNGNEVIVIYKNIYNNKELIGTVAISVKLQELNKTMSKVNIRQHQYIFLVDKNKIRLTYVKPELIGKAIKNLDFAWNDIKKYDSGNIRYTSNGVKKDCVYSTNKLSGWKIINTVTLSYMQSRTEFLLKTYFIFGIVMVLIILLIGYLFNKIFGGVVKKINLNLKNMANGNFTSKILLNTGDEMEEIANNINLTKDSIKTLINKSKDTSSEVIKISYNMNEMIKDFSLSLNQVSNAINDIANESTDQAKNSQLITGEMDNLESIVKSVSTSNTSMNELSNESNSLTKSGISIMEQLEKASFDTKRVNETVNSMFNKLSKSTEKIFNITDTISSIAEQTNLLSLNAGIEAARVGESGKGFAVVAEEIRKLAEESKSATIDIGNITKDIDDKFFIVTNSLKESDERYREIYIAIENTKKIFNDIFVSLKKLTNEVKETGKQFNNVEELNTLVVEKSRGTLVTSENIAATTEELSATTIELNSNTLELQKYSKSLEEACDNLESQIKKFRL